MVFAFDFASVEIFCGPYFLVHNVAKRLQWAVLVVLQNCLRFQKTVFVFKKLSLLKLSSFFKTVFIFQNCLHFSKLSLFFKIVVLKSVLMGVRDQRAREFKSGDDTSHGWQI